MSALRRADSPRQYLDREHIETLAAIDEPFPPIVVRIDTMEVVDGLHRLEAAACRGDREISVRWFQGGQEEGYVYAVHANIAHGLPLSLAERRAAAQHILVTHPQWSDRRIAAVAGLSARAVAELRDLENGLSAADGAAVRVGRDDRARPIDPKRGRLLAARLLGEQPDASLRTIAAQAGVSPGTVRDVRARLIRGEDPVPMRQRRAQPESGVAAATASRPSTAPPGASLPTTGDLTGSQATMDVSPTAITGVPAQLRADARVKRPGNEGSTQACDIEATLRSLRQDPALRLTEVGRFLLRTLEPQLLLAAERQRILHRVPGHVAPRLSAAARAYAVSLNEFADQLESGRR
ncbi:ParB/RepB/Spo0J family partition protein [Streptomyces luteolus]|uniref:ParB/RepB/Spo0J family partition protein n=1 Tax=Streptomyces luteolus TaxID=3043615 RepID=A0ABT6SYP2_9ACTN|nr:ParB/RepB/Spo0J family partition protein [Streptomyces sp. B-S-A12]MDI3420724.1 ParB/RepB/Spo0J family partition protein [Streptomyces sp. B-S-A12]